MFPALPAGARLKIGRYSTATPLTALADVARFHNHRATKLAEGMENFMLTKLTENGASAAAVMELLQPLKETRGLGDSS